MTRLLTVILLLCFLIQPVSAMEFTAPTAPQSAQIYMPEDQENFGEGLWYIIRTALFAVKPELAKALRLCASLVAAVLAMSVLNSFTSMAANSIRLAGSVLVGLLLLEPVNSLIQLGISTVTELSEYGKMLIPVLTAATAAQGGATTATALCAGTVFFSALLTGVITKFVVPALYVYLCVSIAGCALSHESLKKVQDFLKWLITWCLKWILYIFSGYISITGVISGSVDASALKVTKLTLSGMVPVVGGILSDASETILVSAGAMKNAAGVYGVLAVLAICVGPFLQTGLQYLLLKATGAVCDVFGYKPAVDLLQNFSTGMGMILAMTGTVCLLLLVSVVCFMNGMR